MSRTATIQTRIDPVIKKRAQKIFDTLNISMSEAIAIYLTQVTLHNGLPFEVRIPNARTAEVIQKVAKGGELHTVKNVDDLFKELDR